MSYNRRTMARTLEIHDIPDELYESLEARAACLGVPLSSYVQQLMQREAGTPTVREVLDSLASEEPLHLDEPPVEVIRQYRDAEE